MRKLLATVAVIVTLLVPLALAPPPAEAAGPSLEGAMVGLANVPGGAANCLKGIVDEAGKVLNRLIVFMPVTAAISCAANVLATTPTGAATFVTAGAAQFGKGSDLAWSTSPPPVVLDKW